MELIFSPTSPYVRKVLVAAHELEIVDQIKMTQVTTTAFETDSRLASVNPLGKIPTLLRDDGPALYDSRVIMRYLNERADGALYPEGRLWDVLTLEATAHGISDATVSMSYEMRLRPENEQSPSWIEAQWEKAARALDVVEARWMSHLFGPLDAGHIGMGVVLSYIDLRHDVRKWRDTRPALAAWHAKFSERVSMTTTRIDG
ncbi:glutathione S-transferase [Shimia ponticola]|uniref:glutathione S-transferase n=1 Tax=Shimia ponticola TaxID=2582893 RepID=UPI0011BF6727|nr:glutathione S-transferase [Shimia ponticola]